MVGTLFDIELFGQIGAWPWSVLLAFGVCGVALGGRSLDCGLRPPLEMTRNVILGLTPFVIPGLTSIVIPGLTGGLVRDDADWFVGMPDQVGHDERRVGHDEGK